MSKRTPAVEFYTDEGDETQAQRWRVRAANGRIVCPPESHTDRRDARRSFKAMLRALTNPDLRVINLP